MVSDIRATTSVGVMYEARKINAHGNSGWKES